MRLRAAIYHPGVPAESKVVTLSATEGLSTIDDIRATFLCDDPDLDLEALLWTPVTLRIEAPDDGYGRCFCGQIEEADYVATREGHHLYRIRARPKINSLAYRVRTRIFLDKTTREIVEDVFTAAGIPGDHASWAKVVGGVPPGGGPERTYNKRDFTMQWKESELAFVLRLLEDEGIFFWFEHHEAGHDLVFGDSSAAHAPIADGPATLAYSASEEWARECVTGLVFKARTTIDHHLAQDWEWQSSPHTTIEANEQDGADGANLFHEHPARIGDDASAAHRAHDRVKQATNRRYELTGRTNCLRLAPGRTFVVTGAKPTFFDRDYLVRAIEHRYVDSEHRGGEAPNLYVAKLRALPGDVEFRPPRITPVPRISGVESAVVTGPAGEEIHVDEHARIKVHFYFDREGKVLDTDSFWVRTQQMNTSGGMLLPRLGWELSIGFLHGDPDRPVALQKLYNDETLPPYEQPANKTQSALQSSTSPGGAGTHEIRMQDGNGGMELFLHASRDHKTTIGNDALEEIAVDAAHEVGLEFKTSIGGSETQSVGGDQGLSVTGNCTLETTGAKSVHVGGTDDWGITANFTIATGGSRTENIDGLMNVLANKVSENFATTCDRHVGAVQSIVSATVIAEAVAGAKTENVGAAKLVVSPKAVAENIGAAKTLTCGAVVIKTGTDIGFGAGAALTINCAGPIKETISGDFTLNAKTVTVTAPGGATLKGGGSKLTLKGSTIKVDASGFGGKGGPKLELKGTINYKDP